MSQLNIKKKQIVVGWICSFKIHFQITVAFWYKKIDYSHCITFKYEYFTLIEALLGSSSTKPLLSDDHQTLRKYTLILLT
jgi:hypothetical protein